MDDKRDNYPHLEIPENETISNNYRPITCLTITWNDLREEEIYTTHLKAQNRKYIAKELEVQKEVN